jgi:hypothetical protein
MDGRAANSGRASYVRVEKKFASAAHGTLDTANRKGDTLPAEGPGVSLTEGYHMQRQPKGPAPGRRIRPRRERDSADYGAMNGC